MINAVTYLHAVLWACLLPLVFAVVSDCMGMDKVTRLVCLRVLWCLPLAIAALAFACGVMLLLFP
jgi:hypothetical protein